MSRQAERAEVHRSAGTQCGSEFGGVMSRGVARVMSDQSNGRIAEISSSSPAVKPVTLFSATIIVVANMIGTGVFTTLGFQVEGLHSAFAVLLLWVLGGVGAFCGALCYGELGAMMPRSGGEYTFLSDIYHPALGFLSGWVSIVAGFAAPIALTAIALGEYSAAIFPGVDKMVLAMTAIAALTLVHLWDVKRGCQFQNIFTTAKILIIATLVVLGLVCRAASGHRPDPRTPGLGRGVQPRLRRLPRLCVLCLFRLELRLIHRR